MKTTLPGVPKMELDASPENSFHFLMITMKAVANSTLWSWKVIVAAISACFHIAKRGFCIGIVSWSRLYYDESFANTQSIVVRIGREHD